MSTAAQALASRANSLHSTGPRTAEGKSVMFANPLRHGLTARHLIIPGESQEEFDSLLAGLRERYRPVGSEEESLVSQIAEHQWRLARARRVETATLALYVERLLEEAEGDPDRALALAFDRFGKELDRLRRYETTMDRAHLRTRRDLDEAQRRRFYAEAVSDASADEAETAPGSVSHQPEIAGVAAAAPLDNATRNVERSPFLEECLRKLAAYNVSASGVPAPDSRAA